ncbi:hypothetical protein L3X38_007537 [Prunus dulcis]|uniref:Uncharacterized protein n=1 Tax=Prunus dulcis TaxID=3755 RepID=A0AAD4ZUW2_PRUDU|nr:hypothetical protein L3X38_007534 [Prunus dulcis]KAI5354642.1 hypothetical protein L3X38_007537 [Prunus dulcis]
MTQYLRKAGTIRRTKHAVKAQLAGCFRQLDKKPSRLTRTTYHQSLGKRSPAQTPCKISGQARLSLSRRVNVNPLKKPEEIHMSEGFTHRVKHSSFPFHCPGSLHRKGREKSKRLFTSMRKGQQNRDLGTTNGFLTHVSWAAGIHQRRRSGGKQWKEEGKV